MASKNFKQRYDESKLAVDIGYDGNSYERPLSPILLSPGGSTQKLIKDGKIRECFVTLIKQGIVDEYVNVVGRLSNQSDDDQTVPVLTHNDEAIRFDENANVNLRCESSSFFDSTNYANEPVLHKSRNTARKRSPRKRGPGRPKKRKHKQYVGSEHIHSSPDPPSPQEVHDKSDGGVATSILSNRFSPDISVGRENIFSSLNKTFQVNVGVLPEVSKSIPHTCGLQSKQKNNKRRKRKHVNELNAEDATPLSKSKGNKSYRHSSDSEISDMSSYCPAHAAQMLSKENLQSTDASVKQNKNENREYTDEVVILDNSLTQIEQNTSNQEKFQSANLCKRHKMALGFSKEKSENVTDNESILDSQFVTPPHSSPETNRDFQVFHQATSYTDNSISDRDSHSQGEDDNVEGFHEEIPELELCHEQRIAQIDSASGFEDISSERHVSSHYSFTSSVPISNQISDAEQKQTKSPISALSRISGETETAVAALIGMSTHIESDAHDERHEVVNTIIEQPSSGYYQESHSEDSGTPLSTPVTNPQFTLQALTQAVECAIQEEQNSKQDESRIRLESESPEIESMSNEIAKSTVDYTGQPDSRFMDVESTVAADESVTNTVSFSEAEKDQDNESSGKNTNDQTLVEDPDTSPINKTQSVSEDQEHTQEETTQQQISIANERTLPDASVSYIKPRSPAEFKEPVTDPKITDDLQNPINQTASKDQHVAGSQPETNSEKIIIWCRSTDTAVTEEIKPEHEPTNTTQKPVNSDDSATMHMQFESSKVEHQVNKSSDVPEQVTQTPFIENRQVEHSKSSDTTNISHQNEPISQTVQSVSDEVEKSTCKEQGNLPSFEGGTKQMVQQSEEESTLSVATSETDADHFPGTNEKKQDEVTQVTTISSSVSIIKEQPLDQPDSTPNDGKQLSTKLSTDAIDTNRNDHQSGKPEGEDVLYWAANPNQAPDNTRVAITEELDEISNTVTDKSSLQDLQRKQTEMQCNAMAKARLNDIISTLGRKISQEKPSSSEEQSTPTATNLVEEEKESSKTSDKEVNEVEANETESANSQAQAVDETKTTEDVSGGSVRESPSGNTPETNPPSISLARTEVTKSETKEACVAPSTATVVSSIAVEPVVNTTQSTTLTHGQTCTQLTRGQTSTQLTPQQTAYIQLRKPWNRDESAKSSTDEIRELLQINRSQPQRPPPPPYPQHKAITSVAPGIPAQPPNAHGVSGQAVFSPANNIGVPHIIKLRDGNQAVVGFDAKGCPIPYVPPGMIDLQTTVNHGNVPRVTPNQPQSIDARVGTVGTSGTLPTAALQQPFGAAQNPGLLQAVTNRVNQEQTIQFPPLPPSVASTRREGAISQVLELSKLYLKTLETQQGREAVLSDIERLEKISRVSNTQNTSNATPEANTQRTQLTELPIVANGEALSRHILKLNGKNVGAQQGGLDETEVINRIAAVEIHRLQQMQKMEQQQAQQQQAQKQQAQQQQAQLRKKQTTKVHQKRVKEINYRKKAVKLLPSSDNQQEQEMLLQQLREQHQQYIDKQQATLASHQLLMEGGVGIKQYTRQKLLEKHNMNQLRDGQMKQQQHLPFNQVPSTLTTLQQTQNPEPPAYNQLPLEDLIRQRLAQQPQNTPLSQEKLYQNAHELHLLRQMQIQQQRRLMMQQNSAVVRDQLKMMRTKPSFSNVNQVSSAQPIHIAHTATDPSLPKIVDVKSMSEQNPTPGYVPEHHKINQQLQGNVSSPRAQPPTLLEAIPPTKLDNSSASRQIEKIVQEHIVKTSDVVLIPAETVMRRGNTGVTIPTSTSFVRPGVTPTVPSNSSMLPFQMQKTNTATSGMQRLPPPLQQAPRVGLVNPQQATKHAYNQQQQPPRFPPPLMHPNHTRVNNPGNAIAKQIESNDLPTMEYFNKLSPDMKSILTPHGNVPVISLDKLKSFIADNPQVKTMFGRPSSQLATNESDNRAAAVKENSSHNAGGFSNAESTSRNNDGHLKIAESSVGREAVQELSITTTQAQGGNKSGNDIDTNGQKLRVGETEKDYFYLILDQLGMQELGKVNPAKIPRPDIPPGSQLLIPIYADTFPSGDRSPQTKPEEPIVAPPQANEKPLIPAEGISFADFMQMITKISVNESQPSNTEKTRTAISTVEKTVTAYSTSANKQPRVVSETAVNPLSTEKIPPAAPPSAVSNEAQLQSQTKSQTKQIESNEKLWSVVSTSKTEVGNGGNSAEEAPLKMKFKLHKIPQMSLKRKRGRPKGSSNKKSREQSEDDDEEEPEIHTCHFCDFQHSEFRVVRQHQKDDHFAKFSTPPSKSKWNRNKKMGPKELYEGRRNTFAGHPSNLPNEKGIQRQLSDNPSNSSFTQKRLNPSEFPAIQRQLSDNSGQGYAQRFHSIPNLNQETSVDRSNNASDVTGETSVQRSHSNPNLSSITGQETTARMPDNQSGGTGVLDTTKQVFNPEKVSERSDLSTDSADNNEQVNKQDPRDNALKQDSNGDSHGATVEENAKQTKLAVTVITESHSKNPGDLKTSKDEAGSTDKAKESVSFESDETTHLKTVKDKESDTVVSESVSNTIKSETETNETKQELKASKDSRSQDGEASNDKVAKERKESKSQDVESSRDEISKVTMETLAVDTEKECDKIEVSQCSKETNSNTDKSNNSENSQISNATRTDATASTLDKMSTEMFAVSQNVTVKVIDMFAVKPIGSGENNTESIIENSQINNDAKSTATATKPDKISRQTSPVSTNVTVRDTDMIATISADSEDNKTDLTESVTDNYQISKDNGSKATATTQPSDRMNEDTLFASQNVTDKMTDMFAEILTDSDDNNTESEEAPSVCDSEDITTVIGNIPGTSDDNRKMSEDPSPALDIACEEGGSSKINDEEMAERERNASEDIDNNQCSKCHQIFSTAGKLFTHYKLVHTNTKGLHLCYTCGYTTRVSSILQRHIMKWHTKGNKHTCTSKSCGKTFDTAEELKQHMREHFGNKRKYECRLCGQSYHYFNGLKAHQVRHTYDYPFKCGQCGLKFKTKGMLERHEFQRKHFSSAR